MDRRSLLQDGHTGDSRSFEYKIIFDYNVQFKKVENFIKDHWSILRKDKILGPLLPTHPGFIYRKAPTLKDKLALGVIDRPKQKKSMLFDFLTGFHACGRCLVCRHAKINIKKGTKSET